MNPNLITLSYPTIGPSGAQVPAATYQFYTTDYKPPSHSRSISYDIVHNQNGKFKYIYDNGPNFHKWDPFQIVIDDHFASIVGAVATQLNNIEDIWAHQGGLVLGAPDGVYDVHWSGETLDREFIRYPSSVGDKLEYRITLQFEEAS